MESVVKYFAAAATESSEAFVRRYPHLFLIKPGAAPGVASHDEDSHDEGIPTSTTVAFNMLSLKKAAEAEPWVILPLVNQRRTSNPPPVTYVKNQGLRMRLASTSSSALILGRSRHSDLWLPHPSVSHVHAHFLVQPDRRVQVIDQSSTNGTFLRGQKLTPGVVGFARAGDEIRVGTVALNLVDAATLYRALQEAAGA